MANKELINEMNRLAERYDLHYEEGGQLAYEFMPMLMIEMMKEINELKQVKLTTLEFLNQLTDEQYGIKFEECRTSSEQTFNEYLTSVLTKVIEDLAELRSQTGFS